MSLRRPASPPLVGSTSLLPPHYSCPHISHSILLIMTSSQNPLPPIRRVVTSHDSSGVAKVWIDEEVERKEVRSFEGSGLTFGLAWVTNESPAEVQKVSSGQRWCQGAPSWSLMKPRAGSGRHHSPCGRIDQCS